MALAARPVVLVVRAAARAARPVVLVVRAAARAARPVVLVVRRVVLVAVGLWVTGLFFTASRRV